MEAYRQWARIENPGAWARTVAVRRYLHSATRRRDKVHRMVAAGVADGADLTVPGLAAVEERQQGAGTAGDWLPGPRTAASSAPCRRVTAGRIRAACRGSIRPSRTREASSSSTPIPAAGLANVWRTSRARLGLCLGRG